jgi:hypothetical protein
LRAPAVDSFDQEEERVEAKHPACSEGLGAACIGGAKWLQWRQLQARAGRNRGSEGEGKPERKREESFGAALSPRTAERRRASWREIGRREELHGAAC